MRKFFEIYNNRINKLSLAILLFCFIILSVFFEIQILNTNNLKEIVSKKGWKTKIFYGDRGKILDSNGNNLAISINKYNFWVNTNKQYHKDKIISLFSKTFQKPEEFYIEKLNKKSNYLILEKNILYLDCKNILDDIKNIEGLNFKKEKRRFYPNNNIACQVIGYVDLVGKGQGGIEGNFNAILSGDTSKIKLKKGVKGRYYHQINKIKNIENGYNISLTIDVEYQKILHDELNKIKQHTNAESANGIIVDPNNGDILAMASFPDYNPNNYFNYENSSFRNRSIADSYEPGSTFKIITLATALESNRFNLYNQIFCENGETMLLNKKLLRDHEPHGDLSIIDIFAYSSNIGISKLIDNFENIDLYKFCRNFGFNSKTGLPLKSEASGKIRELKNWSKTSKNYISIGQELSITNIQLAMAYCAIANGGYLLEPNIIKTINKEDNTIFYKKVKPIRKVISSNTSNEILNAMEKVITIGTAKNLNMKGYNITGKTGTAQKYIDGEYSHEKFISSFASIFPIDNPQFVVIISIDSPDYGFHWANESAVPAVKEIIKKIIVNQKEINSTKSIILANNKKYNKKMNQDIIKTYSTYDSNKDIKSIVPNFKGKTLKQAFKIANEKGIKLDPNKLSGKIEWQSLKPGDYFNINQICKVKLSI